MKAKIVQSMTTNKSTSAIGLTLMSKRKHIKKDQVVNYWINTDEGSSRIRQIINQVGVPPPFIHIDIECPECFACSNPFGFRYDGKSIKVWNSATALHIAHIIPHSQGGKEEPSNLVLLCSECHRENPDSINEKFFWKWISSRPNWKDLRLKSLLQVPLDRNQLLNLDSIIKDLDQDQLTDLIHKTWMEVNPTIVAGKVSSGSIAEMVHHLADNCLQLKEDPIYEQMELF